MDNIYREQILDHYKHPRNFGTLEHPDVSSSDDLISCGDQISLEMKIDSLNKTVTDIRFQGRGCAISMASASMLTGKIIDKKISDLKKLNRYDILDMLGISLSPTRLKCALLPLEILHKAIGKLT